MLTDLKTRGVEDILIACIDGLKGFPEAVVYIGDSGPSVSLEDGPVVSVILGQQL